MGREKILLYLSVLFLSLIIIPMISAAACSGIVLQTPAASATVSGTYQLNASLNEAENCNSSNATFYYRTYSQTTWTVIKTITTSGTNSSFNTTWDSTGIVDDSDMVFSVNVSNLTSAGGVSNFKTDTSTGVDVDNGNPTSTLGNSMINDNYKVRKGNPFTLVINADSTIGIDNCTFFFMNIRTGAGTTYSQATSSNACSNTTGTPDGYGLTKGENYNVYVCAYDGNNDGTNSSSRLLSYPDSSGYAEDEEVVYTTPTSGGNIFTSIWNFLNNIVNKIVNLF